MTYFLVSLQEATGEERYSAYRFNYQKPVKHDIYAAFGLGPGRNWVTDNVNENLQRKYNRRIAHVRFYRNGFQTNILRETANRTIVINETAPLFQIPNDQANCLLLSFAAQLRGWPQDYRCVYWRRRMAIQAAYYYQDYMVSFVA